MRSRTGVLLVNLGTPLSPKPRDVSRYLIEFLMDDRVIDFPWWKRQLLVKGIIIPMRYRQSAQAYKKIWTEEGSPLLLYGEKVKKKLQAFLGDSFFVELGMRYQFPSIEEALQKLLSKRLDELVLIPLFPQYASATTGSIFKKVTELLSREQTIPHFKAIGSYPTHSKMIDAFCAVAQPYLINAYDHFLFSFHGLPQRHVKKADQIDVCLKKENCCRSCIPENRHCYSAQCYATAQAIANQLALPSHRYSISFQSRLGKDPWLQPYSSSTLQALAKAGNKKILVFSPAFVCDCLETLYEIEEEYGLEFKQAGGTTLDLVPGLNDHPLWIEALASLLLETSPV